MTGGKFALVTVIVTVLCILYMVQYALNDLATGEAEHPGNIKGDQRLAPIMWKFGSSIALTLLLVTVLNYGVGMLVPGAWDPRTAYVVGAGCATIVVTAACFLIIAPWVATAALITLNLPWTVDYLLEAVRVGRTVWTAGSAWKAKNSAGGK
jgi:hypothetical protein